MCTVQLPLGGYPLVVNKYIIIPITSVTISRTVFGFRQDTCITEMCKFLECRLRWARGLRRGSADARLLGLWVRIPPRTWVSVSLNVVCCQEEVSATGWSLVQRSPTECDMSEYDHVASIMRRSWPTGESCAMQRKDSSVITKVGYIAIRRRHYFFFYSGSLLKLQGYALKHRVIEYQQNINPVSFCCYCCCCCSSSSSSSLGPVSMCPDAPQP
jgi:hypothetical protein